MKRHMSWRKTADAPYTCESCDFTTTEADESEMHYRFPVPELPGLEEFVTKIVEKKIAEAITAGWTPPPPAATNTITEN